MRTDGSRVQSKVDADLFRSALGHFGSGVTVVTTTGPDSSPIGLTANAFMSVSVDPPLVAVSVARTSASFPAMEVASHYVVHILHAGQREISKGFARSARESVDKFEEVDWEFRPDGFPALKDYLVRLVCSVVKNVEAGDHVLYIGEVRNIEVQPQSLPALIYYRGRYAQVS